MKWRGKGRQATLKSHRIGLKKQFVPFIAESSGCVSYELLILAENKWDGCSCSQIVFSEGL